MVSTNEHLRRGGIIVGVFAVIGFGIGLTAYFPVSYLNNGGGGFAVSIFGGLVALQSLLLIVFLGPLVAGTAGLLNGYASSALRASAITSSVASFFGFYIMVLFGSGIIIGGFAGGGISSAPSTPTPTPSPTPTTPTPEFAFGQGGYTPVEIGTPSYVPPSIDPMSILQLFALAGIPAGIVGGVSTAFGYWLRQLTAVDEDQLPESNSSSQSREGGVQIDLHQITLPDWIANRSLSAAVVAIVWIAATTGVAINDPFPKAHLLIGGSSLFLSVMLELSHQFHIGYSDSAHREYRKASKTAAILGVVSIIGWYIVQSSLL